MNNQVINLDVVRKIKVLEKEAKELEKSTTIQESKEEQIKLVRLNAQIKIAKLSRNF